ncbi:MAG: hypothetical protein EB059_07795, partial [Alphaproteobacteria bacterium]|nr:hypothetical protein [Alphaproteobacteria bacterium]
MGLDVEIIVSDKTSADGLYKGAVSKEKSNNQIPKIYLQLVKPIQEKDPTTGKISVITEHAFTVPQLQERMKMLEQKKLATDLEKAAMKAFPPIAA